MVVWRKGSKTVFVYHCAQFWCLFGGELWNAMPILCNDDSQNVDWLAVLESDRQIRDGNFGRQHMTRLISCLAALWLSFGTQAHAQQSVLVELFTSQGCSSCPPADKIFAELAQRDDVVALSYHVDYWDYLGWTDEFADPAYTKLQRAYARAAGERTIYTPQMIIGGKDHVIGSRPMKVADMVRKHAAKPHSTAVWVARTGEKVSVRAKAKGQNAGRSLVYLITYIPQATVKIRRGENAGRTISYANIVQSRDALGTWDGKTEFRASARVPLGVPVVVVVQAVNSGPILGVAQLR